MAAVTDDRWTCPTCQRTTIATGSPADVRAALDTVRERHGTGHTAAASARAGSPRQPTRRARGAR